MWPVLQLQAMLDFKVLRDDTNKYANLCYYILSLLEEEVCNLIIIYVMSF